MARVGRSPSPGDGAPPQHLNIYWRPRRASAQDAIPSSVKDKLKVKSPTDGSDDEGSPGPRRGSLLNGLKGFLNQRSRSRSDAAAVKKAFGQAAKEAPVKSPLSVTVNGPEEESCDPVLSKSLNINANIDGEKPGRVKRGPFTGPLPEEGVAEDDEPEFRRRSYSGGAASLIVLRKASRPMSVEIMGKLDKQDQPYRQFLLTQTCYDLLPHMSRLIVLDSRLTIRRSFIVLMENGVRSAPVWTSEDNRLSAMLTQTDFLHLLLDNHQKDFDKNTLSIWLHPEKTLEAKPKKKALVSLRSNETLHTAVQILCANHVHRIPISQLGSTDILFLLSLKAILRLIQRQMRSLPLPVWMRAPVRALSIGTWDQQLHKVQVDTELSVVCELLLRHHLSCLPVVSESGVLVEVIAKTDIVALLAEGEAKTKTPASLYKDLLESRVEDVLKLSGVNLQESPNPLESPVVAACSQRDTLVTIIDKLATRPHRTAYLLDEENQLKGVLSVCDIMKFLSIRKGNSLLP